MDTAHPTKEFDLQWGRYRLRMKARTLIMGVLNVTPDSFSDGGRFLGIEAAVTQGLRLARDGADILDIGGESTRPFSQPVPEAQEIERVVPVIQALADKVDIPISIDTAKAAVAREAIAAGAAIINDITALSGDPEMAPVAVAADVPVILMHMKETPRTMQVAPSYKNLIQEIYDFLEAAVCRAVENGIDRSRLIVDPGIGFGKNQAHNLMLLRNLERFLPLECPILVGSSRKAFLRNILADTGLKDLPPNAPAVETATQASVAAAIFKGAHIVRVHDVASARTTAAVVDAIKTAAA